MTRLTFLEKPDKLVEIALDRATKKSSAIEKKGQMREKKAVYFAEFLTDKMDKAIDAVPEPEDFGEFHCELMKTIESANKMRQLKAHMLTVRKLISKRKRYAIKDIRMGKSGAMKAFVGRVSSIMKSLKGTVREFNTLQKKLREMPKIDSSVKTIILAGFPNVGKTTMLQRLTDSRPEIASYPFTTKQLNLGYYEFKHRKIQVIDTPGLLERTPDERNKIEKKAILAVKHLADLVCFIVDVPEHAEKLENQLGLLESLKKVFGETPCVVLLNKLDLSEKEEIEKAKSVFKGFEVSDCEDWEKLRTALGQKLIERENSPEAQLV